MILLHFVEPLLLHLQNERMNLDATEGPFQHQCSSVSPWTVACQAPLSVRFPRQEYWSGLSFPLPGDLPNPGIKPVSLNSPALAGGFFTTSITREAPGDLYGTPEVKSS